MAPPPTPAPRRPPARQERESLPPEQKKSRAEREREQVEDAILQLARLEGIDRRTERVGEETAQCKLSPGALA